MVHQAAAHVGTGSEFARGLTFKMFALDMSCGLIS